MSTAAQMNPNMLLMMNLMRQQQQQQQNTGSTGSSGSTGLAGLAGLTGSSGSTGSSNAGLLGAMRGGLGSMSGMSRLMNNPMILCRQTENFRPLPCGALPGICEAVSLNTYNFPGLMKCSPMGVGCCIKDIQSLMMVNQIA